jgi:AcrR family transcriptional regulator
MFDSSQLNASFQLILETTEQLIQEKGCRQTTLQDIIDRSGLSKGAIYHYVSSKDELFGLVLKSRMEQMNERFFEMIASKKAQGVVNPLQSIAEGIVRNTDQHDVSNKIFIFLLGQMDKPKVADLIHRIYEFTLNTSSKWIKVGQQEGVIPLSINPEKMALMFITFMYGLRVKNTIVPNQGKIGIEDIFQMMYRSLQ